MLRHHTKLLALLLALTLLFAACGAPTPEPRPRQQIKASEIPYARPDVDKLYGMIDQALTDTQAGGKQQATLDLYEQIIEAIEVSDSMQTLANLRSDMDLSDEYYETEKIFLAQEYPKIDNRMLELTGAILESDYAKAATKRWGEDYVARYQKNKLLNSTEIEPLAARETELVNEYTTLVIQDTTTTYNGKEVTLDDLDPNDPNEAKAYNEICALRNKELGEIFRELVQLRTQIANTLGYTSYTDYAYATWGRDYSKEDVAAFAARVLVDIVPLQKPFLDAYKMDIRAASERHTSDIDRAIPTLEAAFKQQYPAQMGEALRYMQQYEMYCFSDAPNTAHTAYCTFIGNYRAPFMLINTDHFSSASAVFHEFGHYYNFYKADSLRWNDSFVYDTAEIHSQGLEVLMFDSFPALYGEDSQLFVYDNLYSLMAAVVQGCAQDEFQQRVYANPDMSLDEINQVYLEVSQKYLGDETPLEWVEIHHNFDYALYYISYATSAVSALEIWELSTRDRAKAMEVYEKIVSVPQNTAYRDALKVSGLSDPFTSDAVTRIAKALRTELSLDTPSQLAA